MVHRHVLLQSPFFEACLRSQCKESETGIVNLNISDGESFECVLRFLWTGQLEIDQGQDYATSKTTARRYGRKLILVYCIGSFLMLEKLINAVIDSAFEHCLTWAIGPDNMNFLHEQNLQDSKLADLFLRKKVESLRKRGPGALEADSTRPFFTDYFHRSEDRGNRVLKALLDKPVVFSNATNPCRWHTHDHTAPCPKEEQDFDWGLFD